MVAVSIAALAIGAILSLGVATGQQAGGASATVKPQLGFPTTHFTIRFAAPATHGRSVRRYEVKASSRSRRDCASRAFASAPARRAGTAVRIKLIPPSLSHWCPGTYRGKVQELTSTTCPRGEVCPNLFAILTVDRFTFVVKRPPIRPSTGAPEFAGLRAASATCSGGRPGPGQMTSYRLSWFAASDPTTPGSRIVYDIYASHSSGGEDFSAPTWTTSPGVTTYTTPHVPVGSYYFVVRARNEAGHEDRNRVERRGTTWCAYPGWESR